MACHTKSILQDDLGYCFVCGRYGTEVHHVYFGSGNRKVADRMGLVIGLCYYHHRGNGGVHGGNRELDLMLKQTAQRQFEAKYSRAEFLALFGRNYL